MELSWLQILVVVAMIQTEGKLLSAALKAEEENDSVGTAVGHGLVGPKTPAMSRRIAGERGVTRRGSESEVSAFRHALRVVS